MSGVLRIIGLCPHRCAPIFSLESPLRRDTSNHFAPREVPDPQTDEPYTGEGRATPLNQMHLPAWLTFSKRSSAPTAFGNTCLWLPSRRSKWAGRPTGTWTFVPRTNSRE